MMMEARLTLLLAQGGASSVPACEQGLPGQARLPPRRAGMPKVMRPNLVLISESSGIICLLRSQCSLLGYPSSSHWPLSA